MLSLHPSKRVLDLRLFAQIGSPAAAGSLSGLSVESRPIALTNQCMHGATWTYGMWLVTYDSANGQVSTERKPSSCQ